MEGRTHVLVALVGCLCVLLMQPALGSSNPSCIRDGERAPLRLLQANGKVYSTASATYYLYGYVYDGTPSRAEEYPATYIEAEVNCTRMGMEQPDPNNKQDVKAAQYLDAGHTGAGGYGTWIKAAPGGTCAYVTNIDLYLSGCGGHIQYVCVERKPKCGKSTCCAGATCCSGRICCGSGTTCCPLSKQRRYALCVERGNRCPA